MPNITNAGVSVSRGFLLFFLLFYALLTHLKLLVKKYRQNFIKTLDIPLAFLPITVYNILEVGENEVYFGKRSS